MAAPAAGKKVFGVQPKVAVLIFAVVAVGVFWYMRRQSNAAIPTQTQTTPQVAAAGTDPNATGGVAQQAVAPDLSFLGDLLNSFLGQSQQFEQLASSVATAPPTNISTYYNAPYNSPTTTSYTTNYSGATPPIQSGGTNSGGGYTDTGSTHTPPAIMIGSGGVDPGFHLGVTSQPVAGIGGARPSLAS